MRTLACVTLLTLTALSSAAETATYWVFLGTGADGIYRSKFDPATGDLTAPERVVVTKNPTFLAIHPKWKHLYAVGEIPNPKGGAVSAFRLDPATGSLVLLNQQSSGGAGPCHISLDRTARCAMVANYSGGSVASFPLDAEGQLKPAGSVVQHIGHGHDPKRQNKPYAHSINPTPDNRWAVVADLGLDQLKLYRLDATAGTLSPIDPPFVMLAPGAGPRHFTFHPTKPLAFCVNELDSTVSSLSWDEKAGLLKVLSSVSTLPKGVKVANTTAEIVVHPNGKFVYASNRGHDTIASFSLTDDGTLTPLGHAGDGVKVPRNIAIDPTGRYLFVANQGSDTVNLFRLDEATGLLTPTGTVGKVGKPMCVRFVPVAKS